MLTQRIMELQAVVLGQQQQLNAGGQATAQTVTSQGQTPASAGTGKHISNLQVYMSKFRKSFTARSSIPAASKPVGKSSLQSLSIPSARRFSSIRPTTKEATPVSNADYCYYNW